MYPHKILYIRYSPALDRCRTIEHPIPVLAVPLHLKKACVTSSYTV